MENNGFDVDLQQGKNLLKDKPDFGFELLSTVPEAVIADSSNSDSVSIMNTEVLLEKFASALPEHIEQIEKSIVLFKKEIEKIEEKKEHFEEVRKKLSLLYEIIKGSKNQ